MWSRKQSVCKFLTSNCHLLNMSPLSIILFSPVKKLSRLKQERNMQRSSWICKQKSCKNVVMLVYFDVRRQQGMDFFTVGSVIMDYFLDSGVRPEATILSKNTLMMDLIFYKHAASQDVNWLSRVLWITCGSLWCFYQLFGLSFWRHPFTAEDLLASKWCNATFLQICSKEETYSSTSWMAWRWANFQQISI